MELDIELKRRKLIIVNGNTLKIGRKNIPFLLY